MEDDLQNPTKAKKLQREMPRRENAHEEVEVSVNEAKDTIKDWLN